MVDRTVVKREKKTLVSVAKAVTTQVQKAVITQFLKGCVTQKKRGFRVIRAFKNQSSAALNTEVYISAIIPQEYLKKKIIVKSLMRTVDFKLYIYFY